MYKIVNSSTGEAEPEHGLLVAQKRSMAQNMSARFVQFSILHLLIATSKSEPDKYVLKHYLVNLIYCYNKSVKYVDLASVASVG